MIYTVTLNPAVDYYMELSDFHTQKLNRSAGEKIVIGGKGINVSLVLNTLGVPNVALGFVGGPMGKLVSVYLSEQGVRTDFVLLSAGNTRVNVKLRGEGETDINAAGPTVTPQDLKELFDKLDQLRSGDCLVLAGSIPKGVEEDIYCQIMAHLAARDIRFVVDTTGKALTAALAYRPFLIKPNHHELGEVFGRELKSEEEMLQCARELQRMGARHVLVSRAQDGAFLLAEDGSVHRAPCPKGTLRNSVGAGDSMVAGFLAGLAAGELPQALRLGLAAGSATAFSEGLATKEEIMKLL